LQDPRVNPLGVSASERLFGDHERLDPNEVEFQSFG
jgi:hypothetical protein